MPHPVIYPFPHLDTWSEMNDAWPHAAFQTFYNDPAMDGVQLNIRIDSNADMWNYAGSIFDPGLADAAGWIGLMGSLDDIAVMGAGWYTDDFSYLPSETLSANDISDYFTGPVLDFWSFAPSYFMVNDAPAYILPDGLPDYNGFVAPGLYEFPGVASNYGPINGGYFECRDMGRPLLIEVWYSDNPNKTGDTVFNGYTQFGDQTNTFIECTPLGNASEYVRKCVGGILKVDADSKNPAISDIICGVMYTGTIAGGTAVLVINGEIYQQQEITGRLTSIAPFWDTAFELHPDFMGGYAGAVTSIGLYGVVDGATWPYDPGEQIDLNYDPWSIVGTAFGIDTLDVKFVTYLDRVSGLGEGVSTGAFFYPAMPAMYTHPGWTAVISNFWTNFLGQREVV